MRWVLFGLVAIGSCSRKDEPGKGLDLPRSPAHDRKLDGVRHALGFEAPFLCLSPDGLSLELCPQERPPKALLSCDASGCHGDFDYAPTTDPASRHLLGSDGPSCFACHERLWSDWKGESSGVGMPEAPPHDRDIAGALHALGLETPFLCRSEEGTTLESCPDVRPADARLSCDASGCHGDFDYSPATDPAGRHLLGDDGPSCFACHSELWSDRKTGTAGSSGLPTAPAHNEEEDGYRHAQGMDTPFLCLSQDGTAMVTCPDTRPPDVNLSCDASGCHGSFDYSPTTDPAGRHLLGDDGPSCFECHDQEWSERRAGFVPLDEDDDDEDDDEDKDDE